MKSCYVIIHSPGVSQHFHILIKHLKMSANEIKCLYMNEMSGLIHYFENPDCLYGFIVNAML